MRDPTGEHQSGLLAIFHDFHGNLLLVSNAGNAADLSVDPGLVDVQEVQSSSSAFAAILANGKVVAWGDFEGGGEMTQGAE